MAMLALTLSLGVWQIERLHWKRALLADIDRGESVGAVPLTDTPTPFSRVRAAGTFAPGIARYGAEVRATPLGPVLGAHVIAVLQTGAMPVVVDRGWAPMDASVSPPDGQVQVEGYVRPAEVAAWSAASDDPASHRFFTLDPAKIAASLGYGPVVPFTLVVLGSASGYPEPATTLPRPPNDHLSYAITWFSLAFILAVVFAVFVGQTLRQGPRS